MRLNTTTERELIITMDQLVAMVKKAGVMVGPDYRVLYFVDRGGPDSIKIQWRHSATEEDVGP